MGSLSIWHWLVVIVVVLLLFGRGKISELMGDVAQGGRRPLAPRRTPRRFRLPAGTRSWFRRRRFQGRASLIS